MSIPDQTSAAEQAARQRIEACYELDGDAGRLAQYYGAWASAYDLDVSREGYCGPKIVAELAGAMQTAYLGRERAAISILDAGCGTGLVGVQLERLGFRLIDGFDLSETMAEKARQTCVYRHVRGDVNLNGPLSDYPNASYDITASCGVFTQGHVRPDGLRELARVTRPSGFVIASTRKIYAEATAFEDEVRHLQDAGVFALEHCLKDGMLIKEDRAHYWIFRMTHSAYMPTEERP
ncbi:class I SAM-dependent methyltransferase [Mesorhizobium sp.]|uniref:class I SAM-dependent DNA methyltransferase n=1 Tax=Mesorhizobium sp. TaxID=1871066 RepID=UPI000FE4CEE6|nr:class I SAM-dependent methyltransferase [Mesorhizobium sp.]RWI96371.1 MAG: class I SAM-dependent methyltransferase [Mesorhizobium sp.]